MLFRVGFQRRALQQAPASGAREGWRDTPLECRGALPGVPRRFIEPDGMPFVNHVGMSSRGICDRRLVFRSHDAMVRNQAHWTIAELLSLYV